MCGQVLMKVLNFQLMATTNFYNLMSNRQVRIQLQFPKRKKDCIKKNKTMIISA